jgi:hypothetical protein
MKILVLTENFNGWEKAEGWEDIDFSERLEILTTFFYHEEHEGHEEKIKNSSSSSCSS